ncbi:hypothetical protein DTO164E3_2807 [Paecilomyces variotii]|nr:hypothetical protein DTO032I3_4788 [Paecilomyces variotii]KAJ9202834.1 hypothetical protein DTO164E3_2807 [Paecilomyces variotii]KAJ9278797.1 hypothetical protein DTO021D3_4420 [Paecilomyces variotii]KAJ9289702.1 hypothetical protein DTO021C3_2773 [Paecilomyces variotii]KAJ9325088.1 hypothetical protein DTO027B3_3882 [Paecilomyces variotii]
MLMARTSDLISPRWGWRSGRCTECHGVSSYISASNRTAQGYYLFRWTLRAINPPPRGIRPALPDTPLCVVTISDWHGYSSIEGARFLGKLTALRNPRHQDIVQLRAPPDGAARDPEFLVGARRHEGLDVLSATHRTREIPSGGIEEKNEDCARAPSTQF